jgi:hypothetical protein
MWLALMELKLLRFAARLLFSADSGSSGKGDAPLMPPSFLLTVTRGAAATRHELPRSCIVSDYSTGISTD